MSYRAAKDNASNYQEAKHALRGPGAPFSGWVASGVEHDTFDWNGQKVEV